MGMETDVVSPPRTSLFFDIGTGGWEVVEPNTVSEQYMSFSFGRIDGTGQVKFSWVDGRLAVAYNEDELDEAARAFVTYLCSHFPCARETS